MSDKRARAAVVAVGNEITEGRTLNTNATWLSREVRRLGFEPVLHLAVPDVHERIVHALRLAAASARLVLVTGGLGPTVDDITREAAAALAGVGLALDPASLARIEEIFRGLGREPQPNNRRQALLPEGSRVLANPIGTAPGFRLDLGAPEAADAASLFFLPGIPRELERMFAGSVRPALEGDLAPAGVTCALRLNAFGVPESEADAALAPLFADGAVWLGFNVSEGVLEVHLAARGPARAEVEERLAAAAAKVRAALGDKLYGEGEATLAEAVLALLRARGLTLALAESCTAGLCARELGLVPGASEVFLGGVVAYADRVKERHLGVPAALLAEHGAVSEPVALAMAEGALRGFEADVAAAITGVAGPSGGSAEKPVGTVWVAVARRARGAPEAPIEARARRLQLRGERAFVQRLAALAALEMVRRAVARDGA